MSIDQFWGGLSRNMNGNRHDIPGTRPISPPEKYYANGFKRPCQIGQMLSFWVLLIHFCVFSGGNSNTRCRLHLQITSARHAIESSNLGKDCRNCLAPTCQSLAVGTATLHTRVMWILRSCPAVPTLPMSPRH